MGWVVLVRSNIPASISVGAFNNSVPADVAATADAGLGLDLDLDLVFS